MDKGKARVSSSIAAPKQWWKEYSRRVSPRGLREAGLGNTLTGTPSVLSNGRSLRPGVTESSRDSPAAGGQCKTIARASELPGSRPNATQAPIIGRVLRSVSRWGRDSYRTGTYRHPNGRRRHPLGHSRGGLVRRSLRVGLRAYTWTSVEPARQRRISALLRLSSRSDPSAEA